MKTIQLTQGQVALVDDADFEAVNAHKWCAKRKNGLFYAVRALPRVNGKRSCQYLHQFLMPGVPRVDHRDGNSLNDQMGNLRPATKQQNAQGACRKRPGATSRFRGVSWNTQRSKWRATIQAGGHKWLGDFNSEPDAARAYNEAAIKYFGEFAHLNII